MQTSKAIWGILAWSIGMNTKTTTEFVISTQEFVSDAEVQLIGYGNRL
jgi:hypothetical protein